MEIIVCAASWRQIDGREDELTLSAVTGARKEETGLMLPGHNILLQAETSRRMCRCVHASWSAGALLCWGCGMKATGRVLRFLVVYPTLCSGLIAVKQPPSALRQYSPQQCAGRSSILSMAESSQHRQERLSALCSSFTRGDRLRSKYNTPAPCCCCTYHSSNACCWFSVPCFLGVIRKNARAVVIRALCGRLLGCLHRSPIARIHQWYHTAITYCSY